MKNVINEISALSQVRYGLQTIGYSVVRRPARKTLGIEVHPNGQVVALAPVGCDSAHIQSMVRKRARWILRQKAAFAAFDQTPRTYYYVSGEAHYYLGRQYRLRVIVAKDKTDGNTVTLGRNDLVIEANHQLLPGQVRTVLHEWYEKQAHKTFWAILAKYWPRLDIATADEAKPLIVIREMQRRWGSLSGAGRLTLNRMLIRAPAVCIEYVILHELCHTVHPNHSAAFYALLQKLMPDWPARKQRLERANL